MMSCSSVVAVCIDVSLVMIVMHSSISILAFRGFQGGQAPREKIEEERGQDETLRKKKHC